MRRVLITGVSGFIGRNLAQELSDHDFDVFGCDIAAPAVPSENYRELNILDGCALRRWVADVAPEYVYHMAARTDLLGKSMDAYVANTDGVRNIIDACIRSRSVKRLILASSRMVCRIDHIPERYDEYSPPNWYGRSKVEGEQIVRSADTPFEWVMVRPTSIWGPGFGIPYRNFFDQVWAGRYFHQKGNNPLKSFGYVGNTSFQLMALLSASPERVNRKTFYLGDYEPLQVREWADYIHECFALAGRVRTVPMPLLRIAARFGDLANYVTRRDMAPLTSFRLTNLVTNMVYPQLTELEAVTGPLPFSWRQGTMRTVEWMQSEMGRGKS